MRHFIIKFFALDYIVSFFGKKINFTRSANIIFPLMLLCGSLILADKPLTSSVMILAFCLLGVALFLGFGYFRLFPLKAKDAKYFDEVQLFCWYFFHNKTSKEPKKINSWWALWLNPILIAVFLAWYFLFFNL